MTPKFDVGDLVEFAYDLRLHSKQLVGIVTYRYMYNGYTWYKVQWNGNKRQDIAEIELKKVKTDK
tara:strand:- start:1252 stop:1446 length:195 start_codon:yes stop_codon:yes gene_type:complete